MKIPFKHYLHDDSSYETAESIFSQIKDQVDMDVEQLRQLVGKPFYEVTMHCILDTETGEVELVHAEL